jgi:hypothetical protein
MFTLPLPDVLKKISCVFIQRNPILERIEFVDMAGVQIVLCIENNEVVQYRDKEKNVSLHCVFFCY